MTFHFVRQYFTRHDVKVMRKRLNTNRAIGVEKLKLSDVDRDENWTVPMEISSGPHILSCCVAVIVITIALVRRVCCCFLFLLSFLSYYAGYCVHLTRCQVPRKFT